MNDGPAKTPKLGRNWIRFAKTLTNEAVDCPTRTGLASKAILRDILIKPTADLLEDLDRYAARSQFDLDPRPAIEDIFDRHPKSPFTDCLGKNLLYNLAKQIPIDRALESSLESTTEDHILKTQHWISDHCAINSTNIKATEKASAHAVDAFQGIDRPRLKEAVRRGDRSVFNDSCKRKTSLDDGPG